ncbi:MAG: hypothetical protein IKD08_01410 [Alphaproteobacteria bacterium]|nr:hypothetical protein [Alphaproteobacteria bacterium]
MSLNFIVSLVFLGLLSLSGNAFAQTQEEYDPLKERLILPVAEIPNYREEMRNMLITLSEHAKKQSPKFIMAVKGGENLLYRGDWEDVHAELSRAQKYNAKTPEEIFIINLFAEQSDSQKVGSAARRFARNLDGIILENRYCNDRPFATDAIKAIKDFNLTVMGEEICPPGKLSVIENLAASHAVPLYTAPVPEIAFKTIPSDPPFMENAANINELKDARNILIVTDTSGFSSKKSFINQLKQTNHDILVIEPFFQNKTLLTADEIHSLKFKKNGAKRLVLSSFKVATVKDTDFLWRQNWKLQNPFWLRKISDDDESAIVVEYWNPEWQRIIGQYFNSIVFSGFDGAIAEDLNRHLEFEELTPIDY